MSQITATLPPTLKTAILREFACGTLREREREMSNRLVFQRLFCNRSAVLAVAMRHRSTVALLALAGLAFAGPVTGIANAALVEVAYSTSGTFANSGTNSLTVGRRNDHLYGHIAGYLCRHQFGGSRRSVWQLEFHQRAIVGELCQPTVFADHNRDDTRLRFGSDCCYLIGYFD